MKKKNLHAAMAAAMVMCSGTASAALFTFDYTFGQTVIGPSGTVVHGEFTGNWNAGNTYVENVAFSSLSYTLNSVTTTISGGPWTAVQYYQAGGTGALPGDPPPGSPARIHTNLLSNDFFLLDCNFTFGVGCSNIADLSVGFLIRSPGIEASGLFKYPNASGTDWQTLVRADNEQHQGATWLLKEIQTPTAVPEPVTLALLGAGIAGIGFARRRRRIA